MLEDSLFESRGRKKTRKPLTVFLAAVIHVIAGIVLVLIPLFQIQAITIPMSDMSLWAPQPEVRQAIEVTTVAPRVRTRVAVDPNDVIAPQFIPSGIGIVVDEPRPSGDLPLPVVREGPGSILGDLVRRQELLEDPPSPPPAPPPAPLFPHETPRRVRVGSVPQQAILVHQVLPVYPTLAKITRTQGVVILEAVITKEGTVQSLRIIDGHPLLIQAALDAVQQWRYRPTLLNGEPVEVITTITVNFTLR